MFGTNSRGGLENFQVRTPLRKAMSCEHHLQYLAMIPVPSSANCATHTVLLSSTHDAKHVLGKLTIHLGIFQLPWCQPRAPLARFSSLKSYRSGWPWKVWKRLQGQQHCYVCERIQTICSLGSLANGSTLYAHLHAVPILDEPTCQCRIGATMLIVDLETIE